MTLKRLALGIAGAGLLTIYGCGGGGSTTAPTTTVPPTTAITAATTDVPVTVVDGPILNATVCLDKNNNEVCDSDEPSGKTDSNGKVTLKVDPADVGKYPVIAVVGTDAVDADTGAVPVAFTLKAPADQSALITPLTTLVQTVVASTGVSSTAAETQVKAQTGINVSLFEDFSKGTSADHKNAATVARMLVVTTQQQSEAIKAAIGSKTTDGTTITKADLDQAIQQRLHEIMPNLLNALTDPSVQAATTPTEKEKALQAQATAMLRNIGLTSSAMTTVVAVNKQISTNSTVATATPVASASLSSLRFTSASDWLLRVMSGTALQNTPSADGNVKYRELQSAQVPGGTPYSWGSGGSPRRGSDLHWNGSAWANCPINFESTSSVRNAIGKTTYNYCDNDETGFSKRVTVDVSTRNMIDVYNEIKAAGYTNLYITSAATVLGTATFPTGSKLSYQANTSLTGAIAYYPGTSNYVYQSSANVAAGKTSATDTTAACAAVTNVANYGSATATLDGLIAVNKGTPCVYGENTAIGSNGTVLSSGVRSDWWGQSTLSLGTLGTAATGNTPTTSYYTTNTPLRVGFGSGNVANYYSCKQSYNGSTRNCNLIGTGIYTIQTLGDAKVLSFSGLPAQASVLNYKQVFVERNGHVYYGSQSKPVVSKSVRLNLVGLNALFSTLGLPAFDANTPVTLSKASFAGNYGGTFAGTDSGTFSVSISTAGVTSCSGTSAISGAVACTFTLTPSTSSPTTAAIKLGITGTGATFSGTADFTTGTLNGTWVNGSSNSGTFTGGRI